MDEVTPGNVLAARTSRKAWAIYASILEFTLEDLAQELAWFPVMHLISSEVEKLQGGISQVFAGVLKSIFLDGICDPRLGLLFPGDQPLKIFLDLKVILQDGGSHKFCWSYKGDAALKPCLLCNLSADKAAGEYEDEEVHFSKQITYTSLRLFSSQEIVESFDRLEQKKVELSRQDFMLWEKAVRKTYQPAILPLDKKLDSLACFSLQNNMLMIGCMGLVRMALSVWQHMNSSLHCQLLLGKNSANIWLHGFCPSTSPCFM